MEMETIKSMFFESKEGVLEESDLVPILGERRYGDMVRPQECFVDTLGTKHFLYQCPCGGDDHYATRALLADGRPQRMSDVLSCFNWRLGEITQWLIRPRHNDVQGIIQGEEVSCLALLKKVTAIVRKAIAQRGWSQETADFLKDTHGIEQEVAEEIVAGTWHEA